MVRVLYVGGLGRSGTTLVERLIGELPGVCALGEVVHLWRRDVRDDERCACGVPFSGCEFWRAVGDLAFGGWDRLDLPRVLALQAAVERTRHIPWLASRRTTGANRRALVTEYAGYYAHLYAAAAQTSGASVIVDSSKHAALAYCLRFASDVDLRVAHLVRDARAVAYSWTKRVPRPETGGTDEMTRYRPGRSALLWNAHNSAFAMLARCGVPVHRIRYEDFLRDPKAGVAALADFAGLPAPDLSFVDDTRASLGPSHSAAGNPMRFTTGEVPLRRDDGWRTGLPPSQRRLVGAITAPLLAAYGYPLRTRPVEPPTVPAEPRTGPPELRTGPPEPRTGSVER